MNKQIVHDALVLTAFTLVIGVILGAVYGITKAPIDKANEEAKKEAYQAVFADADAFNQKDYDADEANKMVSDAGYEQLMHPVTYLDMSSQLPPKTEAREASHSLLVSRMTVR